MRIYTRKQFSQIIGGGKCGDRQDRDLQILITRAKQKKLLSIRGQQRITCNKENLYDLHKIATFIVWVNKIETPQLRTAIQTKKLIDNLLDCLLKNKQFTVFAFLCPSYKKGDYALGFNSEIGDTTKLGIINTFMTYQK